MAFLHQGVPIIIQGLPLSDKSIYANGEGTRPWVAMFKENYSFSIEKKKDSESLIIEMNAHEKISTLLLANNVVLTISTKSNPGHHEVNSNMNLKMRYTPNSDPTKPGLLEVLDYSELVKAKNRGSSE